MSLLKELKKENRQLFSFYLISGNREQNKAEVLEFLEGDLKVPTKGNADFFLMEGEKFLIDRARDIKKLNAKTKADGGLRIFILSFESVGADTQNALLKVLEEPTENTIFFWLISDSSKILETVKSRARIIENLTSELSEVAQEYLQADFSAREKIVADLNPQEMQNFFNSLDLLLLEKQSKNPGFLNFYKKFLSLKKYVGRKGVSYKNIFSYLNIYTPQK